MTIQQVIELLNLRRLPGRLDEGQTSAIVGCKEHDIAVLIREGLLRPLGKPAKNSVKYFSSTDVITAATDRRWLDRATQAISRNWKRRNEKNQDQVGSKDEHDADMAEC